MPETRKGMEIPQVSISVDTSDSGAQSVETCREVNSLENNSDEVNDGSDTGVKLCVNKAECDLKRTLMCRSLTLGNPRHPVLNSNNSSCHNNNHSVPYNNSNRSSRSSLVFTPHGGVSERYVNVKSAYRFIDCLDKFVNYRVALNNWLLMTNQSKWHC